MNGRQILFHMLRNMQISPKKTFTFLVNYMNFVLGRETAFGYPSVMMIEPTNFCNLKCPLCPTGNNSLNVPRGFMKFDDFKKMIDEVGSSLLNLTLWNYGEPFLNKDIYRMMEYACKKRIFTRISTNGHFFEDEANIRKLVASGVDNLIVSLDGASQETFSKYRKNGNFEVVINNICKITKEKDAQKKNKPFVEVQFILMKHNEHEVPKMKELAKTLDVDKVKLKTVNIEMDLSQEVKDMMKEYLPRSERLTRYKTDGGLARKGMKKSCKRLWLSSVINWDGSVSACCYDPNRKYDLGNALQSGFKAVWNNDQYRSFRKNVKKNKRSIEMCKNCTGDLMGLDVEVG